MRAGSEYTFMVTFKSRCAGITAERKQTDWLVKTAAAIPCLVAACMYARWVAPTVCLTANPPPVEGSCMLCLTRPRVVSREHGADAAVKNFIYVKYVANIGAKIMTMQNSDSPHSIILYSKL